MYVTINERLYGGFTPYSAALPGQGLVGEASSVSDFAERAPRLVGLWLDRSYGALRWAPVIALAFFALWLLWRSHRDRIARALPERREVEVAATLCALICAAQVAAAAFLAPTMFGLWFPGRHLLAALPLAVALCAWGLRRAPRAGAALIALTIVSSIWLYAELRIAGGALIGPSSRAPLGPLDGALPLFEGGSHGATAALCLAGAALAALLVYEWIAWRRGARLTAP